MADRFLGRMVVAIDGPAGSGKSSVSREAARRLGFGILDTGAAYRALTWAALRNNVDPEDTAAVSHLLHTFEYRARTDPDDSRVYVGDVDVTDSIRTAEVTERIARFSKQPAVREYLNGVLFPALISHDPHPGLTIEGRDITTVVAPDAPVRILLTASAEVRAERRAKQLGVAANAVADQIRARDAKDSAVVDFFTPAPGVQVVDTSELNFDQAVEAVIALVREKEKTT